MSKHTTTIIACLLLMLIMVLINNTISSYIIIALAICLLTYSTLFQLQQAEKKCEANFVLRKQRQSLRPWFIILAVISVIAYFINSKSGITTPAILMFTAVFDITTSYIVRNKKPVSLVVNGCEIKFINRWGKPRNLENLERINLNGLSDEIRFSFRDEKNFYLKRSEYNTEDVDALIELVKVKSKMQVMVSDNLIHKNAVVLPDLN